MGKKCTFLACLLVLGSVSSSSGLRFKLPTDVTVLPISVVQVAEANHAPSEMSEEGGESGDTGTSHDEDPKSASEYFKPDLVKRGTLKQHTEQNPSGQVEKGVTPHLKDPKEATIGHVSPQKSSEGKQGEMSGSSSSSGPLGASGSSGPLGASKPSTDHSAHITMVASVDTKGQTFGTPEEALLNSPKKIG